MDEMDTVRTAASELTNGRTPVAGVATAGQIRADQFERLALAGYRTVVDLRLPSEPRGFEEPTAVRQAGMEYVSLPVAGSLTDEAIAGLRSVLRDATKRPAVVHCASGNRVGGLMIPYLILDEGMDTPAAIQAAVEVGLRSRELVDEALTYVERERA